jgi:superfamily II DNA/RNA helicase
VQQRARGLLDERVDVDCGQDLSLDQQRCQPVHRTPGHVGLCSRILPLDHAAALVGPKQADQLFEQGVGRLTQLREVSPGDRLLAVHQAVVRRILDRTAKRRQTLLFSATLDGDIAVLSRAYQHDPVRHDAGTVDSEAIDAKHHFWLVQHHDRVEHTADLIKAADRSIVFTRTRHGADRLAKQLSKLGVSAVAMHGGRSQNQRNRALQAFSTYRAQALIATDVAARGIHIDAVASVIHFDPPADHKDYLHRSGRTARAGATGTVVSLVTGDQKRAVRRMQNELNLDAPIEAPALDALDHGGARIGEPSTNGSRPAPKGPQGSRSEERQARPSKRSGKPSNGSAPKKSGESVYVANLPWGTTESDVARMFERFGDVQGTTLIFDRKTGRSKGFGFVDMPRPAARTAIDALHGTKMGGRDLTVRLAKPRAGRR